jgi:hypothetical protein
MEEEEKHSVGGEKKGRGWLRARRVFNQTGPSNYRSLPADVVFSRSPPCPHSNKATRFSSTAINAPSWEAHTRRPSGTEPAGAMVGDHHLERRTGCSRRCCSTIGPQWQYILSF